jgi:hypothetical protein
MFYYDISCNMHLGFTFKCRREEIIKEYNDWCHQQFLYDVACDALLSRKGGILAQVGYGQNAKILKFEICFVNLIGDIPELDTYCLTNFKLRSKKGQQISACRICDEKNRWDFWTSLQGNGLDIVNKDAYKNFKFRNSQQTQNLGSQKSFILQKLANHDQKKAQGRLLPNKRGIKILSENEEEVVRKAELLGIRAGNSRAFELFEEGDIFFLLLMKTTISNAII